MASGVAVWLAGWLNNAERSSGLLECTACCGQTRAGLDSERVRQAGSRGGTGGVVVVLDSQRVRQAGGRYEDGVESVSSIRSRGRSSRCQRLSWRCHGHASRAVQSAGPSPASLELTPGHLADHRSARLGVSEGQLGVDHHADGLPADRLTIARLRLTGG